MSDFDFLGDKKHPGETPWSFSAAGAEVWEKPQVAGALPRDLAILSSGILDFFFGRGANIWVFPEIRGGPPKWMVKIMENLIKMDDLGGKPTIFGNIHI